MRLRSTTCVNGLCRSGAGERGRRRRQAVATLLLSARRTLRMGREKPAAERALRAGGCAAIRRRCAARQFLRFLMVAVISGASVRNLTAWITVVPIIVLIETRNGR